MNIAVQDGFWRVVAEAAGEYATKDEVLPIKGYGHPMLDRVCDEVTVNAETVQTLLKMYCTLKNADGAGLAAPQVGVSQRLVVIRTDHPAFDEDREETQGRALLMANPRIVKASADMMTWADEKCLSLPGFVATTERHRRVEVVYTDVQGKECRLRPQGRLLNACLQHEVQHLNGEMFWSKIPDPDSRYMQLLQWAEVSQKLVINPPAYPMEWCRMPL